MGRRLHQINQHIADMENLAKSILGRSAEIAKIRSECPHCFKFSFQSNAFHQTLWWVIYQCDECGDEKKEKKEPVCSIHDVTLVKCDASDTEAEHERKKPEYQGYSNIPMAYRCPAADCRKIHILWHNGD